MPEEVEKRYVGFLTYPMFWVDRDEAFRRIEKGEKVNIGKRVFELQTHDYELVLLRNGLILYREEVLEEEYFNERNKILEDSRYDFFSSSVKIRTKYLDTLNLIQFLLECSFHSDGRNMYYMHTYDTNHLSYYSITLDKNGICRATDYSMNSLSELFFNSKTK